MSHTDPFLACNLIKYSVHIVDNLDHLSTKPKQIAGIIDPSIREIQISNDFPKTVQRFTLAHELGHALLHEGMSRHRDMPLDGANFKGKRSPAEVEANKFATNFLMPEDILTLRFKQKFLTEKFVINDDTVFALDPSNKQNLRQRIKTLRDLTSYLSKVGPYSGNHYHSLVIQFEVSEKAMAIRLEELDLVIF